METYYRMEDFRKAILYANIAEDMVIDQNMHHEKMQDSTILFYIIQTRGKSRHKIGITGRLKQIISKP
jgi:hypothetical protein